MGFPKSVWSLTPWRLGEEIIERGASQGAKVEYVPKDTLCEDAFPSTYVCFLFKRWEKMDLEYSYNFSLLGCSYLASASFIPSGKSNHPFSLTAKSLQSCPTLCEPIDSSPPGSPIPGILQAKTLEWFTISFSNARKWKVKVKSLSHVRLLATPWTAVYQAPPSIGFSRQEYWSGLPLPSPPSVLSGAQSGEEEIGKWGNARTCIQSVA